MAFVPRRDDTASAKAGITRNCYRHGIVMAHGRVPMITRRSLVMAVAGFSATAVGIGIGRFSYTALIPALIEQGWTSQAEAGYLGATNLLGYLIGASVADRVVSRFGFRRALIASFLACVIGVAACAWPLSLAWLMLWRLLVGIAGAMLMVLAAPTILPAMPAADRAVASGVIFTGVGVGVALSAVALPLLAGEPLPLVWLGLAALMLALIAIGWRGWPPERTVEAAGGAAPPAPRGLMALLLVAYVLDAVGFVPHSLFLADYVARELGRGVASGARYWMLFGIGAALGSICVGWAAARFGFGRALIGAFVVKTLAVSMPLFVPPGAWLGLSALLVGALTPGTTALLSGRTAEFMPQALQRRAWGWMTTAFSLGQAGASYAMTALAAAWTSYVGLYALGAVALAVATGCVLASHRLSPNEARA
jgi:predicted MFS family arabinose efflux permease